MRDGVAHERPSHMRNPAAQKPADYGGCNSGDEGSLHECVLENVYLRHGVPPQCEYLRKFQGSAGGRLQKEFLSKDPARLWFY